MTTSIQRACVNVPILPVDRESSEQYSNELSLNRSVGIPYTANSNADRWKGRSFDKRVSRCGDAMLLVAVRACLLSIPLLFELTLARLLMCVVRIFNVGR